MLLIVLSVKTAMVQSCTTFIVKEAVVDRVVGIEMVVVTS
jgi:hypothetical protein